MRIRFMAAMAATALAAACSGEMQTPTTPGAVVVPLNVQSEQHAGEPHHYGTNLSGGEEVPANTSLARGQAIFLLDHDGTALSYKLIVANIQNVLQAHIHRAAAGTNGPIVVWLYPSAPPAQLIPGRSQGVLNEGVITAANLVGPMAGQTLDDLLAELQAGNAYVNVHTSQFPPGEIRGQIR
jgi:hypothetical protein